MGLYAQGKKLAQPYRNGKKMNAYVNGKKVWEIKDYIPENGLRLVFNTSDNITIGMAGRINSDIMYGRNYSWDIYLNGVFVNNYTGTTSATQTIVIPNSNPGPHTISMEYKLTNKDYCARSINYKGSSAISNSNLTEVYGYGTAFTGSSDMPSYAFYCMFYNCTSLIIPPVLPATTIGYNAYGSMFNGCTSLIIPPVLPATTLNNGAYDYMFYNCSSLKEVRCYYGSNLNSTYAQGWLSNISTIGKLYSPGAKITYNKPSTWKAVAL